MYKNIYVVVLGFFDNVLINFTIHKGFCSNFQYTNAGKCTSTSSFS